MVDQEKVIKGLEWCMNEKHDCYREKGCPYENEGEDIGCKYALHRDALALLKEQEPPTDVSISSAIECLLHPQDADDSDMAKAIDTAVHTMRLLKAQEPKPPIVKENSYGWKFYYCPSCGKEFYQNNKFRFCEKCGQAVKWND